MGRDKALVEVGGRVLAVRVAEALADAGATEVFAVGGALDALGHLGLHAVPDDFPGEGPLGGLLTALSHAASPLVAVLACDLPAAAPSAVRLVVAALDADLHLACAIPLVHGRSEPLHGAWRRSSRPQIQAMFDRGERAVHRVIAGLAGTAVHGVDPAALADADTPAELAPPPPHAAF